MGLIRYPGMKAQMNAGSNTRHLVSIAQANATWVVSKQKIVLVPNGCVKWAVKQQLLLILNCMRVAMLTNVLITWCPKWEPSISLNLKQSTWRTDSTMLCFGLWDGRAKAKKQRRKPTSAATIVWIIMGQLFE